MKFLKRIWHRILVFLRIRKYYSYIGKKQYLQNIKTYQQANLAYLKNLHYHISTANMKFKVGDKLEADLTDGVVKFKSKE